MNSYDFIFCQDITFLYDGNAHPTSTNYLGQWEDIKHQLKVDLKIINGTHLLVSQMLFIHFY